MKIKYEFDDTLSKKEKWHIYNEMQGIVFSRREFKKNENAKLKTLFGHNIIRAGAYLMAILLYFMFFIVFEKFVFLVFAIMMTIITVYCILYYYLYFKRFANAVSVGEASLLFNEEGFEDSNKETRIFKAWNQIDYVVIGYYSVVFILKDNSLFFHFPIELEKQIKKAIKKYQPELKVLDKRK